MGNNANTVKTICKVCGGSGGWKNKDIKHWSDDNWINCLFCEGYGFVEKEKDEYAPFLLAYNGYKKMIVDLLDDFGEIISYTTKDRASTVEIGFIPRDRNVFADLAKKLLKFGYYNTRMDTEILQVFFYEPAYDRHSYYWKIVLKPSDIMDLDGFVDFLRTWGNNNRGRGRKRDG